MKTEWMIFCVGALLGCQPAFDGPEPAYEGCATDEHWILMDQAAARSGPGAPVWLEPGDGAALSPSLPAAFRYQPAAAAAGAPDGDVSCGHFRAPAAGDDGGAGPGAPRHLPPVSGTLYDLRFQVAGRTAYRVLTTRQSVRVPAATWAGWAGQEVVADLRAARLLVNQVLGDPLAAPQRRVLLAKGPGAP